MLILGHQFHIEAADFRAVRLCAQHHALGYGLELFGECLRAERRRLLVITPYRSNNRHRSRLASRQVAVLTLRQSRLGPER
jgi:hypothetical protein